MLRERDFAVTEIPAHGRSGTVTLLNCYVQRKKAEDARKIILEIDPTAFITIEDIISQHHGYWGGTNIRH